jgi:hypothetical protein
MSMVARTWLAAPEVRPEHVRLQREDHHDDKREDRDDLGHRHDLVDGGGFLHPPADQDVENPDARRGQQHRGDGIALAEDARPQQPHGGHDQHPVGHVADARAGPVPPPGEEAKVLTEAGLRVRVERAKLRGSENTPAPTMDPTTIAMSVVSGNFRTCAAALVSVSTEANCLPPATGPRRYRKRVTTASRPPIITSGGPDQITLAG